MKILSPDDILISAVDGLLAIPQRRGVPLPVAILPLSFIVPLGFLLALMGPVTLSGTLAPNKVVGDWVLAGLFSFLSVASALMGIVESRRRMSDAGSWSPALAARYRSEALRARETEVRERYLRLMVIVALACVTIAIVSDMNRAPGGAFLALVAGGCALAAVGRALVIYARCAMPRDPDATLRSPAAQVTG